MTEPELKPCPFCGGPAKLVDYGADAQPDDMDLDIGEWWLAGCEACGVQLPQQGENPTREQAIAAWNRRLP